MRALPVPAALRDRVAAVRLVSSGAGAFPVLPGTGAVFGVQRAGRVWTPEGPLSPAGLTGVQTGLRRYAHHEPTTSLLLTFTPLGAACFGVPLDALTGRSVGLEDLQGPAAARALAGRVAEAPSPEAALAALTEHLAARPFAPDPAVALALPLLTGPDAPSLTQVARAVALSPRQLERRFRAAVGLSPQHFQALHRFERAAADLRSAPSLTEAALAAGYYDQSHFVRAFQRFAGMSPGAWRATLAAHND